MTAEEKFVDKILTRNRVFSAVDVIEASLLVHDAVSRVKMRRQLVRWMREVVLDAAAGRTSLKESRLPRLVEKRLRAMLPYLFRGVRR